VHHFYHLVFYGMLENNLPFTGRKSYHMFIKRPQ